VKRGNVYYCPIRDAIGVMFYIQPLYGITSIDFGYFVLSMNTADLEKRVVYIGTLN
jgi:hypothetical protein